jgi:hypothetical protein
LRFLNRQQLVYSRGFFNVASYKQLARNPVIAGHDPQSIVVRRSGGDGSRVVARDDGTGTPASEGHSLRFVFRGRIYPKLGMTKARYVMQNRSSQISGNVECHRISRYF